MPPAAWQGPEDIREIDREQINQPPRTQKFGHPRVGIFTPLQLGKSFTPNQGNAGGLSRLTINIANGSGFTIGPALYPLTNISGADTLPAGLTIATSPALTTTCTTGMVTAPAGGNKITFSGVNLDANTSCSITLNVLVAPGTPVGTLINTIPAKSVTTDQGITNSGRPVGGGGWGDGSAGAGLQVTNANVTINKTFTPANVPVGTTSQLAVQFVNTNPGHITLTQATLTDNLPMGMVVANPPSVSFASPGCAGTVTATPGASTVTLSNAQINANSTCTLKVNVVASAAGNLINTIAASALTSIQNVSNAQPSAATLAVSGEADLSITKTDGQTQMAAGTETTYTVVVGNTGPHNVAGALVDDPSASGMTITNWTCVAEDGASCGAATGSGPIHDAIYINVGGKVTYTVQAQVALGHSAAAITNTATVTAPPLVVDPDLGNNTASDTNTVAPGVVLALTKTDGSATYMPGGTATYTITAQNTGPVNATQVNIADTLPAGVTLNSAVSCTPSGAATCGTLTQDFGFSTSGATLPANAGGMLTFSVPVKFAADMSAATITNTVSASDAPSQASTTASDSDTLPPKADISVTKTGPANVSPGAPISYTVKISNAGPADAGNATFSDPVPASITGITASCGSPSGGAACPASVDISGNTVTAAIATLPAGGSVTITINGTTSSANSAALVNTATVQPPAGMTDPDLTNNSSTVTTETLLVIAPVPVLDHWRLVLLSLLLGSLGLGIRRKMN